MLHASLKRTQTVDLSAPLLAYIKSQFTSKDCKDVQQPLASLSAQRAALRDVCRKGVSGSIDVQEAIAIHQQYFDTLCMLDARFPFGVAQGMNFFSKTKVVAVAFEWSDAFRPNKVATSYDINLEKAAVLFNLGAYESFQATNQDRSDANGLSQAGKHFMASAGIFTFLASSASFKHPQTADLHEDSYKMLRTVMLAQAQSCFFELAIMKGLSAGVTAKLAQGAAKLFHAASALSRRQPLGDWLQRSVYNWGQHLEYQQACFEAAAYYWQAVATIKNEQYGEEIAWLRRALTSSSLARERESNMPKGLGNARIKLQHLIQERLKSAEQDNDVIYHYEIPREGALAEINAIIKAKATDFDPATIQGCPVNTELHAAFSELVPLVVQQQAHEYRRQLGQMIQEIKHDCDSSHTLAQQQLSSMGLPASLDACNSEDEGLPDAMWQQLCAIREQGGVALLEKLQTEAQQRAASALAALAQLREDLQKEESADAAMKVQWAAQWRRTPSSQVNRMYVSEADGIARFLQDTCRADERIEAQITQQRPLWEATLTASRAELNNRLPHSSGSGASAASNESGEKLRYLLLQLESSATARQALLAELEVQVDKAVIVPALLASFESDSVTTQEVYAKGMEEFVVPQQRIAASLTKDMELLEDITTTNAVFVQTQDRSQTVQKRQEALQNLNVAVSSFNEVLVTLKEAINVYTKIVNETIAPLARTVSDFTRARNQEQQLLLQQIMADLSSQVESKYQHPPHPVVAAAAQADVLAATGTTYESAPMFNVPPSANRHTQQTAPPASGDGWPCPDCTFKNHPDIRTCEVCGLELGKEASPTPAPRPALPPQTRHRCRRRRACWCCRVD